MTAPLSTTGELSLPGYRVPDGVIFGWPTRLTDSWVPDHERMWLPAFRVPEAAFRAGVERGETGPASIHRRPQGPTQRAKTAVKRRLERRLKTIELPGRLVYDARGIDNNNVAHILQHVAGHVWLGLERLGRGGGGGGSAGGGGGAEGGGGEQPLIVVRARERELPERIYRALGFEVLRTDASVSGEVLRVESSSFYQVLGAMTPPALPVTPGTPRRIFISRRGTRRITNEGEIAALLTGRGFTTVYFEELPIQDQWSMVRGAEEIVAIHGAALGWLAMRRLAGPGGGAGPFRLTEIFPPGFIVNCFRQYAAVLGGTWTATRGRVTPEVLRDIDVRGENMKHAFADFEVHADALEQAINFHGQAVPAAGAASPAPAPPPPPPASPAPAPRRAQASPLA